MPVDNGPEKISRYEIQDRIARGGMGRVYLARDPNTSRLVVVKLLDATLDSDEVRDRFDREAKSLASLSHPNIVHIYDYGDFHESPFIVMEYVRGETLEEKIKRRAPLSVAEKLRLMSDLCAGLAHAHQSGIIHRDVKPANVMVDHDERVKIIDFGIARVADSSLTQGHSLAGLGQLQIGTPGYMSPEQTLGDTIDHRTDIFAIGAVCYELLAYREAFPGTTPKEIENKVMRTPPGPLAAELPDVDPELDAILARAMARDPKGRYQDATSLAEAFERCRARLGGSRPAPAVRAAAPVRQAPPTASSRPVRPAPRRSEPEAVSIDPTVLIERASRPAATPDHIEPTVVIQREDLRRLADTTARPAPAPPPRQARPAADPTVLIPSRKAPASPPSTSRSSLGAFLGSLGDRLKGTAGARGTQSSRRQPASKPGAAKKPKKSGDLTPTARGALIAIGAVAVAALFLLGSVQLVRRLWPSGQELTIDRPTGGTIVGAGLQCGSRGADCRTTQSDGESVELQAEADQDYVFAGFTGDCAPTGRMIMTEAKRCGAKFDKVGPAERRAVEWPLTITKPVGGSILASGDIVCGALGDVCSANLADGQRVALRFTSEPGYKFVAYTGDCAPKGETVMSGGRICGATFAPTPGANLADATPVDGRRPQRESPRPPSGDKPQTPSKPDQGPGQTTSTQAQTGTPTALPGGTPPTGQGGKAEQAPTAPTAEKPAPPPVSAEEHAKKEIVALVHRYCREMESRNAERVQAVYPQIDVRRLRDFFREHKSLKCSTSEPKFDRLDAGEAGGAQVTVEMKQILEMKSGGAPKVNETISSFRISRGKFREAWLIDRIDHEAKPK